jgi:prenyltransferase/squalene oxidase-like repeat protein
VSECDGLREAMIDGLLGQSEEGDAGRVAAHVEACGRCRAEQEALRETVRLARIEPRIAVSPRFRKNLGARLDAIDRREDRRHHRHERTAAAVSLEVARHRLRRMPAALKVAAALLPFAIGAIWLLNRRPAPSPDGGTPVTIVPKQGSDRRDGLPPDAPRNRANWPPPPDRPDVDPNPPSPTLLDELVGIPKAAPPDDAGKTAGGTPPAPSDPSRGDSNPDADKIWRPRPAPDLPVVRLPDAPKPPAAAPATATPVARALNWLVRTQRPDGSWAPGEGGEPGLDTGTTALALLAFVSEGYVGASDAPEGDVRGRAARAAAAWLFGQQSPANGSFVGGRDDAARIFCHAVSCLALVERNVRLLAADTPAHANDAKREHEPLERALTRLEGDLERLNHPGRNDPAVARCAGQNAAWAAVALTTARNCGVDFHLKPTGDRLIDEVLMRLRNEQPELIVATWHAVDAMAERTRGPADEAWRRAVEKVVKDPVAIEPSLRFLVATTLAATRRGRPDSAASYAEFEARLARALLSMQSPEAGYFDSNRRWDFFGGGPAYETSLAVLSLSVSERADQFAALRAKLTRKK